MTRFLRFTIYAPLASWGEPAVGEIRGSWDRPSRSAILGMLAAALGILREDDAAHVRLDESLGVAVRLLARGTTLIDYHTTQNPKPSVVKKRKPTTRRMALDLDEPETALSRRWLRQDSLYVVALWLRPESAVTFDQLVDALQRPAFTLYAGRKANALGLPLLPVVLDAESLAAAMRDDPQLPDGLAALRPSEGWGREVAHDRCLGFDAALAAVSSVARRDASPVRSRWQFAERTVYIGRIPPQASA